MRIITVDHDLADVSTNGFATGLTGPGPFTTFTVSTPTDGIAHKISLTAPAANDLSAITMTITGTDADGIALVEARLGPGSSTTVNTTGYFKTLTSITASVSLGALVMDVGWSAGSVSRTICLNRYGDAVAGIAVFVTGTVAYNVEQTFSPFNSANEVISGVGSPKLWIRNITVFGGATTVAISAAGGPQQSANGVRLVTDSYSSGAELQMFVTQTSASS